MESTGGNIRLLCYRLRLQEPQLSVAQDRMPGSLCTSDHSFSLLFPLDWVSSAANSRAMLFRWLSTKQSSSVAVAAVNQEPLRTGGPPSTPAHSIVKPTEMRRIDESMFLVSILIWSYVL